MTVADTMAKDVVLSAATMSATVINPDIVIIVGGTVDEADIIHRDGWLWPPCWTKLLSPVIAKTIAVDALLFDVTAAMDSNVVVSPCPGPFMRV